MGMYPRTGEEGIVGLQRLHIPDRHGQVETETWMKIAAGG
jgi:hypothetical protein